MLSLWHLANYLIHNMSLLNRHYLESARQRLNCTCQSSVANRDSEHSSAELLQDYPSDMQSFTSHEVPCH
jgi:hypothetical protein